jgi:hypothetical protein
MNINQLKKKLGLTNSEIAGFFDLTPMGYANSSAKKRYETALCRFYAFCKKAARGEKENKTSTGDE